MTSTRSLASTGLAAMLCQLLCAQTVSAALAVVPVDLHERLYLDRRPAVAELPLIATPRGGTATFQFAVVSDTQVTARIAVSPVRQTGGAELAGHVRLHRLLPVHVEGNTQGSLKNRPGGEVPEGWMKYLVRAAPFDTLEVLEESTEVPLKRRAFQLSVGQTAGVVVEVEVPADAVPDECRGTLLVEAPGQRAEAPFAFRVHRTALPSPLPLHSVHWLWPEPHNLTNGAVPEWWSERHWQLVENSAKELRRFGDDTVYTPLLNYKDPLIQMTRKADGSFAFDYTRFDRWAELFLKLGFRYLAGQHILNLPQSYLGGVFVLDEQTGEKQPFPTDREAWLTFLPTLYDSLSAHLRDRGWTEHYLQHQYDEPKDAALYQRLTELARRHLPGVRTLDAINSAQQDVFSPLVDVQVFNLLGLNKFQAVAAKRRAEGRGVWLYHCTSPYTPHPNRHLDSHLTECRLYPWLCFKLGADGFLHWGANIYRGADEYRTSIGPFPNGSQDPGHPPGDNWLYYRGPDGLRPSMRIVSFREGLVDNALLTALAQKDAAAAVELTQRVARSVTDYERGPAAYHQARQSLLELLDR